MTELILLRHGQTKANIKGAYSGKTDLPLLNESIEQVIAAARCLPKFDCVYSSEAIRAKQTASIIAPNTPVKYLKALREIDFGDFEGLSADEIEKLMPKVWQRYLDDFMGFIFPNGDSVEGYLTDAAKTIRSIVKSHPGKRILIVGHKGFIMCTLSYYLHGDLSHIFSYDIRPCCFAWLSIAGDSGVLKQLT
ncbi:MAG: histidine phosphatase family protein [Christensenellales bacterium]|jgi:alpha-ribazole phosphatase